MGEGVLLPLKMEVRLIIFSPLDGRFYNGVTTYLIIGINKKTKIEKFLILLIWNLIYIDHRKLHGFGPKYNLMIKCMALFFSYNLEIETYKNKHWSINPWSKLGGYVTRWEGVRHPTCSMKPVF